MSEMTLEELDAFAQRLSDAALESYDEGDDDTDEGQSEQELLKAQEDLLSCRVALEDIIQSNGVSRGMMVSLENFLPDRYPLNSFTRIPTQTNLRQAVVSLEQKNWTAISIIISAIITLISTIIKIIFDRRHSLNKDDSERAAKLASDIINRTERRDTPPDTNQFNDSVNGKDWNRLMEAVSIEPDPLVIAVFASGSSIYDRLMDRLETTTKTLEEMVDNGVKMEDQGTLPRYTQLIDSASTIAIKQFNNRQIDVEESVGGLGSLMGQIGHIFDEWANDSAIANFDIEGYLNRMVQHKAGIAWYVIENDIGDVSRQDDRDLNKRIDRIRDSLRALSQSEFEMTEYIQGIDSEHLAEIQLNFQNEVKDVIQSINQAITAILSYSQLRQRVLSIEAKVYQYLVSYSRQI